MTGRSSKLISTLLCCSMMVGTSFATTTRILSEEKILDYTPETKVVDEAALDLDLKGVVEQLSLGLESSMTVANDIYSNGAYSASYAQLTLESPLVSAVARGTTVTGETAGGSDISGTMLEPASVGDKVIKVLYKVSGLQKNYVNCQVGKSLSPSYSGCFRNKGDITVSNGGTYSYSYDRRVDNFNDRTLKQLSVESRTTMQLCGPNMGCPMQDYGEYVDYYGRNDFADHWITSAFSGGSTTFNNGNANFDLYGPVGRGEAIQRGIVSMSVLQTVQQHIMNSVGVCKSKCNANACSEDPLPYWDTAVAYYVGSETKLGFGKGGLFPFVTAEDVCSDFGTCRVSQTYKSNVNEEIMQEFNKGQQFIAYKDCANAEASANRIISLTSVPLVQGTLRAAYYVDKFQETREKEVATMASFAAAVLPRVHFCNINDANTININTKVGASTTSFADVKAAFERRYDCLGITCADVGGLLDFNAGGYLKGAEPCGNVASVRTTGSSSSGGDSGISKTAKIVIIVVVACAVVTALAVIFSRSKRRSEIEEDLNLEVSEPSVPEVHETPEEAPAGDKQVV